jgi:hypothetical protein
MRFGRSFLSAILPVLLLLAACSGSDSEDVADAG